MYLCNYFFNNHGTFPQILKTSIRITCLRTKSKRMWLNQFWKKQLVRLLLNVTLYMHLFRTNRRSSKSSTELALPSVSNMLCIWMCGNVNTLLLKSAPSWNLFVIPFISIGTFWERVPKHRIESTDRKTAKFLWQRRPFNQFQSPLHQTTCQNTPWEQLLL